LACLKYLLLENRMCTMTTNGHLLLSRRYGLMSLSVTSVTTIQCW